MVLLPVPALGRRPGPRPLRAAPGQAHAGHQPAAPQREQWYSLAERAPDEATAAWLHQVFAPTAAAIDGLEAALAGLGLLDDALALDLRRPQDYFQRIWDTGFRAAELARAADDADAVPGDDPDDERGELEATA